MQQPLKISDFARGGDGDSHAHSALVGGMLILTGIAVGISLAESSKALQGEILRDTPPRPATPSSPDVTALLAGEILKLLK